MEIASERYTKTCRWVLTLAHIQADEARATVITTEHMTAALAQETGCSAAKAMSRMGVDLESLKRAMLQEEDKPPTWIQPEFDEMAEAAITTAGRTARLMGDPQIVFSVNYFCRSYCLTRECYRNSSPLFPIPTKTNSTFSLRSDAGSSEVE